MAELELRSVTKVFSGDRRVVDDVSIRDPGRLVRGARRARPGAASRRRCAPSPGLEKIDAGEILIGGRRVNDDLPAAPRRRLRLPELRAVSAHDGRREHGLRPADAARPVPGDQGAGDRDRPRPRDRAAPRPLPDAALRRRAAARRARPGDRPRPGGLPARRAALEPGRPAAQRDAPRPQPDPAASRRDVRLRHPRPGRGDDARGRAGGHARRRAAAGRHPRRRSTPGPRTRSSRASSARRG